VNVVRLDDLSDADLFARCRKGVEAAFDVLYRRHTPRLWSIVRSEGLDEASAADVVQTTWLNLVSDYGQLKNPGSIRAWLNTVTRHEARRVAIFRRTRGADGTPLEHLRSSLPTPAEAVIAAADRELLLQAFARLSTFCQQLLRLMFSAELAYAEISEIVDRPVGALGPSRQRCLDRLATLFESSPSRDVSEGFTVTPDLLNVMRPPR
jgi:RNA polymerase sigma factor (sigma-70 family)